MIMRRYKDMALMALMMVWGAVQMMAQERGDFTFNPGVRYSQWVTKARLSTDWSARTPTKTKAITLLVRG